MDALPENPYYRVIVNPWAGRGAGERLLPQIEDLLSGLRHDLVVTGPDVKALNRQGRLHLALSIILVHQRELAVSASEVNCRVDERRGP